MATEFSMTGIMNAALISQGLEEINESVSLPEHRVLSRNWPLIVEAELEDGAYHFTKVETTLNTRTDGKFGFDDAYLLPGDALHVRKARLEASSGSRWEPEWVQDDRYVYLDSTDGVIVEYVKVTEPTFWTANFARGVQMKLEAALLRAVKEETGEASNMEQMAEAQFQRARTNSSKARKAQEPFRRSRLADARFGRG
ncbi:hypothetical protein [Roseovarius amoyensis]|uniref:hypothetical protein n=1 Tax=Roseovarius amoyensis TaxID=2211448 RepID=UPI000DBE9E30|nr:hypothetical protein [Roseovarius amoyensis]